MFELFPFPQILLKEKENKKQSPSAKLLAILGCVLSMTSKQNAKYPRKAIVVINAVISNCL